MKLVEYICQGKLARVERCIIRFAQKAPEIGKMFLNFYSFHPFKMKLGNGQYMARQQRVCFFSFVFYDFWLENDVKMRNTLFNPKIRICEI